MIVASAPNLLYIRNSVSFLVSSFPKRDTVLAFSGRINGLPADLHGIVIENVADVIDWKAHWNLRDLLRHTHDRRDCHGLHRSGPYKPA